MEPQPTWTTTPTNPTFEVRPLDDLELHGYRALCNRLRSLEQQLAAEKDLRRQLLDGLLTSTHELTLRLGDLEHQLALLSARPTVSACRCGAPVPETKRAVLRAWLHSED